MVSVTTDGFLTDIEDLENKLLQLPTNDTPLLLKYRSLREALTSFEGVEPTVEALEIKTKGKGMISWTTRGQMGIEGKNIATTGFQKAGYDKNELIEIFKETLKSKNKILEYTRKTLRSAKDIFDYRGHVISTFKDQSFRLYHDNRRRILHEDKLKFGQTDLSSTFLDSKPLLDKNHCKSLRFLSKFPFTLPFNKNNTNRGQTKYKTQKEIAIRNFIKAYHSSNNKFGLNGNEFKFLYNLINFINGITSTKGIRLTPNSISKLKNRPMTWKPVPPTEENILFVQKIKEAFPNFKDKLFLKSD